MEQKNTDSEFLKNNLVDSYDSYLKLIRHKLYRLNFYLVLGYITYALPVAGFLFFFFLLIKHPTTIENISELVIYGYLFISFFLAGMFYMLFKEVLINKKDRLKSIYHLYGSKAFDIITKNKPFLLYARGFLEERDLGNKHTSNFLDRYFNIKSMMEEEMDSITNKSYIPKNLSKAITESGYSIVGLGHPQIERSMREVDMLFCKDDVWEEVFQYLANTSDFIILNTLEKHGDYWLKFGKGLEKEFNILLNNSTFLNKTYVIHNKFKNKLPETHILNQLIKKAKWASSFHLHNSKIQEFGLPKGKVPAEFLELISKSKN